MYSPFQLARKYLHYYFTASNGRGHGMHSPFIFDFILKVLNDRRQYPSYSRVESLRNALLRDERIIDVTDLGAGSVSGNNKQRKVSSIARHAAKPAKYGQLLFRLAQYYAPGTILELGTSLGISTAYLAMAQPASRVISIEGAGSVLAIAAENLRKLQLQNIELKAGNFDEVLPSVIRDLATIDLAFLDGNHRMQPTLQYFNSILNKVHPNSVIIIDDIHWSEEMEQAWQVIKNHVAVKCTVDLFFIGIVFFREEFHERQHFSIRF